MSVLQKVVRYNVCSWVGQTLTKWIKWETAFFVQQPIFYYLECSASSQHQCEEPSLCNS